MARDSRGPYRNEGGPEEDEFGLPPIGPVASQGQLPPPHHAPVTEGDRIAIPHHLAPQPPSPSQHSAVSPMAHESASTEYFPALPVPSNNLSAAQSRSSMRDRRGSRGSASSGSAFREPATPSAIPRQPSIRIRRRGGSGGSNRSSLLEQPSIGSLGSNVGSSTGGRARSSSQPERPNAQQHLQNIARHSRTPHVAMPRLTEEGNRPTMEELGMANQPPPPDSTWSLPQQTHSNEEIPDNAQVPQRDGPLRRMSRMFWTRRPSVSSSGQPQPDANDLQRTDMSHDEYDAAVVDYLDTIDPEVQALTALTNVQNSLFVPDLGSWLNRRPTYTLSDYNFDEKFSRRPAPRPAQPPPEGTIPEADEAKEQERVAEAAESSDERPELQRLSTIASHITPAHYAALPHGATLEGWTEDEKWELDDYVRHMMHSRRSKFKRSMKGFGQYVSRPLGFFVTLYATLITLFGLAWVLFLIGWIYIDNKQEYVIHVIDSVLVALFAIMGDGLAPFRAIDTYHMIWVIRYAHIIKMAQRKARKEAEKREQEKLQEEAEICNSANRTPLADDNANMQLGEEPHRSNSYTMANNIVDAEDARSGIEAYEDTPLTTAQMKKLHHHQSKLAKSHSFYKPNETGTHYAFPLNYLIAIVILLDCHSCLQISLGATTWGINYETRPIAITTVILCVSIACNISAGIVITMGGKKTRKKDVWKLMTRQELTSLAIKKVEENRTKEADELEAKRQHKKEVREKKDREKAISPETGLELGSGSNSNST